MVDKTIMDMPDLGEAPADGDYIEMVDVSDTTDSPAGSSKRVSIGNLPSGSSLPADAAGYLENDGAGALSWSTPAGGGGSGASNRILIHEEILSSGSLDLNNIPQDYENLEIEWRLQGQKAPTSGYFARIYANEDAADTAYHTQLAAALNAGAIPVELAYPALGSVYTGGGTNFSVGFLRIQDYSVASFAKLTQGTFTERRSDTELYTGTLGGQLATTDPITRIRIQEESPGAGLTGVVRVYGTKNVTFEDSETITVKKAVPVTLVGGEFVIDLTDYQDGDRLIVQANIRSSSGESVEDRLYVEINGDTTSGNYRYQHMVAPNGGPFAGQGSGNFLSALTPSTAAAGRFTEMTCVVEGYADAAKTKAVRAQVAMARGDGLLAVINNYVERTGSTDAITELILTTGAAETLSGSVECYIEKEGVLPVVPTAAGLHEIATITDPVSGEFEWTGIPQTYKRLIVRGIVRSDVSAYEDILYGLLNNDATIGNYHHTYTRAINSGNYAGEGDSPSIGLSSAGNSESDAYATFELVIENYTGGHRKIIESNWTNPANVNDTYIGRSVVFSSVTDAVTALLIKADGGDALAGIMTLYGEH